MVGGTATRYRRTRLSWAHNDLEDLIRIAPSHNHWNPIQTGPGQTRSRRQDVEPFRKRARRFLAQWRAASHPADRAILWEKARLAKQRVEELYAQRREEVARGSRRPSGYHGHRRNARGEVAQQPP